MLSEILRSRWFSACVHAGMWLLLLLIVTGIGGKRPLFREAEPNPAAVTAPVPVAKLENLFAPSHRRKPPGAATSLNPFITSHFMPQTTPPPPAPTTRKIELTYHGFYQTGNSPKRAMIRFGDALFGISIGGSVATNLLVADATPLTLTLTNPAAAGQTNILKLNTKKEIEIPLQ